VISLEVSFGSGRSHHTVDDFAATHQKFCATAIRTKANDVGLQISGVGALRRRTVRALAEGSVAPLIEHLSRERPRCSAD
jgi:hypothetical protein